MATARTPSIADLRKSYERAELNEAASHALPLDQFGQWLDEAIAAEVPEPLWAASCGLQRVLC